MPSRTRRSGSRPEQILRFAGPAPFIQALVPVPADALLGASLTVTSEDGDIDVPVQVLFLTPEHSAVAVLPGNVLTAGTHEGTLTAGESTWAAIVEMPLSTIYARYQSGQ